jgi:UDP-glucose 4-epimerase
MKYLITGANGFIGSYLSAYLLKSGHQVVALSRSFLPEVKEQLKGAEFIESDILSDEFVNLKLQADVIVHLASSNDILSRDLSKGVELSVKGTVNTLNLAVKNKITKYIFYSTLQVYGSELSGYYNEESPVKPENDYAMNHLFGEMYAEMFSRKYDLNVVIVRPSNIFGSFLSKTINRWTLVPGCFCKEAIEKGTITLMSSGNQNRNFISLEQLSYATSLIADKMQRKFDIINFVVPSTRRIVEMAILTKGILERDFNKKIHLEIQSDLPKQTNQFYFSNAKLNDYGITLKTLDDQSVENEIRHIIRLLVN